MKTIKRYSFLLISLIWVAGMAQGQNTRDLLKAHTWRSEDRIFYVRFDNQFMYDYSYYTSSGIDHENYPYKGQYYLSNNKNFDQNGVNFQTSLVGNTTTGKYIILHGLVLEIVRLTSMELQLKPLNRTGGMEIRYLPYTGALPPGFPQ